MGDGALAIGRRVLVSGMAGSGKSTFSRALSAKTGLPVIHLDVHYWKPGWVKTVERRMAGTATPAARRRGLDRRWQLPRDTQSASNVRTPSCFSTRAGRCALVAAFLRGLRKPVGEMPEGCRDSARRRLRDEWRLGVIIFRNRRSEPEREHEIISQHGQTEPHVLRSKRAAGEFLDRVVTTGRNGSSDRSPRLLRLITEDRIRVPRRQTHVRDQSV